MFKKKITSLFLILFFAVSGFKLSGENEFDSLYNLYLTKDFFRLEAGLTSQQNNLEPWQSDVLKSFELNAFGQYEKSEELIDGLIEKNLESIPDSIMSRLFLTKTNNDVKLGEYKKAFESSKIIVDKYSSSLNNSLLDDVKNSMKIWQALSDVPKMKLLNRKALTIQIESDLAGLYNVPVKFGNKEFDFVFDTGANFSTITESNAKETGLQIFPIDFEVGTGTGEKVKAKVAVAKSFQLGELLFSDVVFLVLPDKALEFAGGIYKISGIVGFPVIDAMEEIRINNKNELRITNEEFSNSGKNLFFDGFMPIVQGIIDDDTLSFVFDSGAKQSSLYQPYYNLHRQHIEKNYKSKTIQIQGAGTKKNIKVFVMGTKEIRINNNSSTFKEINVYTEPLKIEDNYFHGKIGRDYFEGFKEVIINFKHPSINFVK